MAPDPSLVPKARPPHDRPGAGHGDGAVDWEAFYGSYRKPGYLPGYEILQKLGAGAFGVVFKARKQSIGKDYAVKFLRVEDAETRADVLRELEVIRHFAQLDHPNLVAIEDRGIVDGIPYIVMNYAGDETLRTRLDRCAADGPMPRDEALAIFVQVARGVQALHEHSLVHFDLKPANVYLRGSVARVGDYGLSRVVTRSHNTLSFGRGTPYYMAPELLRRRGDHRSDIYSLGVMLYECLCGRVPFTGDSEWEVLRRHETEAPEWPEVIGPRERAVLARCLAKQPEERFENVTAMVDALFGASPAESGAAPEPARSRRATARAAGAAAAAGAHETAPEVAGRLARLADMRAHEIGHGRRRRTSGWRWLFRLVAAFMLLSYCTARGNPSPATLWADAASATVAPDMPVKTSRHVVRAEVPRPVPAVTELIPAANVWPRFVAGTAAEVLDWLADADLVHEPELGRLRRICKRMARDR